MSLTSAIVDSHVHQWDPRTTPREATLAVKLFGWSPRLIDFVVRHGMPKPLVDFVGRGEYVLESYLPSDFYADCGRHQDRLYGFVHVQAGWKGKRHIDVVDETRWLESIDPAGTTIRAIVGAAHLEAPDLADVLDAHQRASPRFVGVRDMLAAHPSKAIVDWGSDRTSRWTKSRSTTPRSSRASTRSCRHGPTKRRPSSSPRMHASSTRSANDGDNNDGPRATGWPSA